MTGRAGKEEGTRSNHKSQQEQKHQLDDVFEAFATCDFQTAAVLAVQELKAGEKTEQEERATLLPQEEKDEDSSKDSMASSAVFPGEDQEVDRQRGIAGSSLILPNSSGDAVTVVILLTEQCTRADKLAGVLLQCAFELDEAGQEAEAYFAQYYAKMGAMPFPVAIIWLQICLARGGYEPVKRVLLELLMALQRGLLQLQQQNQQEGEKDQKGDSRENVSIEEVEASEKKRIRRIYSSVYCQAMEMLVMKVLLVLGEGNVAIEMLRRDQYLKAGQRQRLLEYCRNEVRRAARASPRARSDSSSRKAVGSAAVMTGNSRNGGHHHGQGARCLLPGQEAMARQATTSSLTARGRFKDSIASFLATIWPTVDRHAHSGGQEYPLTLRPRRLSTFARRWAMALLGFVVLALTFHVRKYAAARGMRAGDLRRWFMEGGSRVLKTLVHTLLLGGK